jgi:hypothetical protein
MEENSNVGMEQSGLHWTEFHEIKYLGIFRKSAQKILVSLKSDENYYYYYYYYYFIFNCNWIDTRWQQYSTHLHTNSTQNTENGTYMTIKRNLESAGRALSLRVIPWHLPYN